MFMFQEHGLGALRNMCVRHSDYQVDLRVISEEESEDKNQRANSEL